MAKHELKTLPKYFDDVKSGRKNFEVRKADRNYMEGDYLVLNEWTPNCGYSGRTCTKFINYILKDEEYCKEGYWILGW